MQACAHITRALSPTLPVSEIAKLTPTDKWILLTGIEVLEMQGTIPAVAKTDSYECPLGGSAEGVDFLIIKFDFSAMW